MSERVPSRREVVSAAVWLGKHGVRVGIPTRLLATRLGVRQGARTRGLWVRQAVVILVAIACAVGYQCLQYLPGVRGVEMTESKVLYFFAFGTQGASWLAVRRRDRQAAAALGARALDRPRPSWPRLLGGWYLVSAVITFAGGAALGVTMFVTTPYRTYAWSWLGVLGLGAVVFAVVLTGVVRRPVIAEDEASLAVDAVLRSEDLYLVAPPMYALPVLFDLVTTHRQPPGYAPWLIGYVLLALGTLLVGALGRRWRRPALPDRDHGVPLPAQAGVNRSPEEAR